MSYTHGIIPTANHDLIRTSRRKPVRHLHALVSLRFEDAASREQFVQALHRQATVTVIGRDHIDFEQGYLAVIHLRYVARGANRHDVSRHLDAAAKNTGIRPQMVREP